MRRRVRVALVIGLTTALVAVAGLFVFRIAVLEALLTTAMRAKGVPAPQLSVVELSWGSNRIDDIRFGQAGEVTVRSLRLDFTPSGLLVGRLERVAIDGLSVTLNLTGDGPALGSLQPLLSGGGNGGGESTPLPSLSLTDFHIEAQLPEGLVRATGEGQVQTTDSGETTVELSLQEIALDDRAVASGQLSATFTDTLANATLALNAEAAAIDASATIEDPLGAPIWRLNLSAAVDATEPLLAALAHPAPQSGRARLILEGEGRTPALSELATADDRLRRLFGGQATGTVDVSVADVSVPEHVTGLNARVRVAIDGAEGIVTLGLPEDATVAAKQVSPSFLRNLGIPGEITDKFAQGLAARLAPLSADSPVAVASPDGGAVAMAFDGTLHLAIPRFADLSLTLPLGIRAGRDRITGQLRAPADLHLKTLRYDEIAELLEPAALALVEANVTMRPETGLDYRMAFEGSALHLRLNPQDANAIDATISPGRVAVVPGRTEIAEARIEMPAYEVVADGLAATLETIDDETRIGFQIASLQQTTLLAPIAVTGQANRTGTVWQGSAKGKGPGGIGLIDASGSYDGATARGQAHVAVEPLVFEPRGLQPGTLSPPLKALQAVRGTTTGKAELSWSAQGLQGTGTLTMKDIGFDSPQARVQGLNLALHLDSLAPLGSPPRQTLTVRRLESGLPLDRLDIRFQIQPTTPPSLAIETGEVFFGSGRFALSDLVIDPATPRQDVDIGVQDLSLAELFAILGIDGLSGDGRLSGTIPMTFSEGTVVIADGRLAASAPGIVRFRSEQAAQILADQGESLDLVLRALEDFHYDELTVDLEKSANDVGLIKLSLLGKNPAVLEGYPFRFNISIEADTGKLVTALTTIYQVPNDLLRRTWTSGQ